MSKKAKEQLDSILDTLRIDAVVQVVSVNSGFISAGDAEIYVSCRGLNWENGFPLGLYFYGKYTESELDDFVRKFPVDEVFKVSGTYSVMLPENGGITIYDGVITRFSKSQEEFVSKCFQVNCNGKYLYDCI